MINCAGTGRRLGLGKTKAMASVLGRPLIEWNLRMLRDVEDVVVVAGYQSREVVETVRELRRDAAIAFNREYTTTGTAASFALGCAGARGDVISLDGDLLVDPSDFQTFLDDPEPALGVTPPTSTDAVLVSASHEGGRATATAFSYGVGEYESTALVRLPAELVFEARDRHLADGHVFEMLNAYLPLGLRDVNAREIDTYEDYERAVEWLGPIADRWGV